GGALGFIPSSFLTDLVTVYVAVPVLVAMAVFGAVVITGIPLYEVGPRFNAWRDQYRRDEPGEQPTYGVDEAYDTPLVLDDEPARPALES
ncbi:hypothetical protein MKD49_25970, partial [Herbaspirillum sp. WGmk3]|uniref:hypothetical protein n=1 Tax=Herbaspirillum sp. WGmk3 TaxID=2919925 RepID=UPI002091668B